MKSQYVEWRDYLTREIEYSLSLPQGESYVLLHSASLVGLFTCVFVKSTLWKNVKDVRNAEVRRGMGGLAGNKVGFEPSCSEMAF